MSINTIFLHGEIRRKHILVEKIPFYMELCNCKIQLTLIISNTDNSNYCLSQSKCWIMLV